MPPERLDHFMARANAAYYGSQNPFADFTTAPEIGQVFGELLGAWAAVVWGQMGRPAQVLLAEAGPGQGTLMRDALRLIDRVAPDFAAALAVHFVEISPRLRAMQAQAVPRAHWHDDLTDLPPGPTILLANEFFDALPIRQFVRTPAGWTERYVRDGAWVLLPAAAPREDYPVGSVLEICEPAAEFAAKLAARLVAQGGAALILDYAYTRTQPGETLQALRGGRKADPRCDPGLADLTAHVDFAAITRAAQGEGAAVWGPVSQGVFLDRLGLRARTQRLAASNPGKEAQLREAADRLSHPARMGQLFKALCIAAPELPAPPGF